MIEKRERDGEEWGGRDFSLFPFSVLQALSAQRTESSRFIKPGNFCWRNEEVGRVETVFARALVSDVAKYIQNTGAPSETNGLEKPDAI